MTSYPSKASFSSKLSLKYNIFTVVLLLFSFRLPFFFSHNFIMCPVTLLGRFQFSIKKKKLRGFATVLAYSLCLILNVFPWCNATIPILFYKEWDLQGGRGDAFQSN